MSDVSSVIEEPVIVVMDRAVIGPPHVGCEVGGRDKAYTISYRDLYSSRVNAMREITRRTATKKLLMG
jgi:hypothetical protein